MASSRLDTALEGCKSETIALLKEHSRLRLFEKGSSLYEQFDPSDCIYVIVDGCAIVERTNPSGDTTSFRIATAGDYLGHRSYFAGEPRSTAPRSIMDTHALHIPGSVVAQALEQDLGLYRLFTRELASDDGPRLGAVIRSNRVLGLVRLAFLLHHLEERLARSNGEMDDAERIPFTQNDLANMLDLRTETVSRLVHQLQDAGMISVESNPRRIVVTDRAALTEVISEYL